MHCCNLRLAIVVNAECLIRFQKFSTFANSFGWRMTNAVPPYVPEKGHRRTIVDKLMLSSTLPDNYPPPWPYKEEGFSKLQIWIDKSRDRHHKNSKLIVVEGNIASGKSEFAANLADELGFHHMPAFSMNEILIDRYGNDLRKFYHLFPKRFRVPDELAFYQKPDDDLTAVMQDLIYLCRWEQYLNALAHIFNTGQGVVLEKSVLGDFVFANAMREKNWISMEYFKYYHFVRKATLFYLEFWPHLVIYLDCPAWKCLENIKKRGNAHEIAAIDEKYLKTIEESYKDMLRECKRHSHILTYDWTVPEYMDIVLDDIFKLNMDMFEKHSGELMENWFNIGDQDNHYGWKRHYFTHKRSLLMRAFGEFERLHLEVAELYIYPPDARHFRHVMRHEVVKSPYTYGWTERDPKTMSGMTQWDTGMMTPENWFEYFHKDYWYACLHPPGWQIDPLDKSYDPTYLHHH